MAGMLDPELLDALAARATARVAEGFDPPERIVESLIEELGDDEAVDGAELAEAARAATDAALTAHREAQRSWPVPTDCDRVDRAFAALEREGVCARQHFTCCQTCGHAEIQDELDGHDGYVFYHWQDTEAAVDGFGLCLAYGAARPGAEAAAEIGARVVRALEREGLRASWDGSVDRRIEVRVEWKRRRY